MAGIPTHRGVVVDYRDARLAAHKGRFAARNRIPPRPCGKLCFVTPRRVGWWLAASFWAIFGLITGIQVWISMITHGHSIPRLIGYYLAVWQAWLAATAFIVWLVRRFPVIPPRRFNVLVHFLAASSIAVVHGLYWLGLLILIKPFDVMTAEPHEL